MGRKKTVKLADKLAAIRSKKEDDKNKADFEAQDTMKTKMPKKLKNYPSWKADLEAFKDGGKVNVAVDKIREIMEEAQYRLEGGREEGQVWNYINESLPANIKGKEKRDEMTDKVYNMVAKRVGAHTIGDKATMSYDKNNKNWVVLYSDGSKSKQFRDKENAKKFLNRINLRYEAGGYAEDGEYMAEGGSIMEKRERVVDYYLNNDVFDDPKAYDLTEEDLKDAQKTNYKKIEDAIVKYHGLDDDANVKERFEALGLEDDEYAKGGYMAKGGALEHGLKVGDQVHSMLENYIGVYNEKEDEYATIDISKGERKIIDMYRPKDQSKKEYGGYAEDGEYMAAGGKILSRKYLQSRAKNVFTFGYGMPKDAIDMYGTKGGTEYFIMPDGKVYKKSKEDINTFELIGMDDASHMAGGGMLKKLQITRQNPFPEGGTSFKNIYISASPKDMHAALGEPTRRGSADDKVQFSWIYEHNGKIVTIYDYKENPLSKTSSKKIDWHVGGNNTDAAQEVADIVKEKLGISTKKPTYEELYEKVYGTKPDFKMMHGGETHRADNK
jgi:hypothetical protein